MSLARLLATSSPSPLSYPAPDDCLTSLAFVMSHQRSFTTFPLHHRVLRKAEESYSDPEKAFISTAFESQGDRTDRYGEVSFLAALDSDPGLHTPHMLHCLADISRSAPRQEDRIDSMASKIHASYACLFRRAPVMTGISATGAQ
ncbi:hypothetical protein CC2G_007169 [Coprinopsis cinerea AmutBmut pab1-1]|nr:hypothetical protein CC2G_007169 [Coprinopsis cinerea AmutBmut pab1-1]